MINLSKRSFLFLPLSTFKSMGRGSLSGTPAHACQKSCEATFLKGEALRSAPRVSAEGGQFDARSARSVFPTYTPPEKRFYFFSPSPDGETLRGFFDSLRQGAGWFSIRPLVFFCPVMWEEELVRRTGLWYTCERIVRIRWSGSAGLPAAKRPSTGAETAGTPAAAPRTTPAHGPADTAMASAAPAPGAPGR